MMGTQGINTKEKLSSMLETQRMLMALITQYQFKLFHHDEIMADINAQFEVIREQKAIAIHDFNAAPQKIIDLTKQLKELQDDHINLKNLTSGKTQRIAKFKALKARLDMLQQELEAEGIDPESGVKVEVE